MSSGVNKVILIGRLANEPDARRTPAGLAVATISLATNEAWQDKQTGKWQERTEWHRVVFFDRLAEIVKLYLHKGSQIYVEGRLRTRKWQDQNGQDRYTTEIIAREMQMLGSRAHAGYGAPGGSCPDYAAQNTGYAAPPPPQPVNQGMGQPAPPQPGVEQAPSPGENMGQPSSSNGTR